MISILALSVVGSWSYAGFLAEPSPAPPPAPEPPPASAPVVPEAGKPPEGNPPEEKPPEAKPMAGSPAPATPPKTPTRPPSAIPPRPPVYRSTDASGQAWEHPDAAYLASFVEARNRSSVIYNQASLGPYRASRCYNGRCN